MNNIVLQINHLYIAQCTELTNVDTCAGLQMLNDTLIIHRTDHTKLMFGKYYLMNCTETHFDIKKMFLFMIITRAVVRLQVNPFNLSKISDNSEAF